MPAKIILYYNDLMFQPSETFLYKDFGQVPYVLADLHGADLEYWIAAEHPHPGFDRFRGRRVRQFAKRMRVLPARLDVLRNGGLYRAIADADITHLMIFPFTPMTDLAVARRAQRRGARILLKLDTNDDYLTALAASWSRHKLGWRRRLTQAYHYRELLRIADVVICETSACEAILRKGFLGLDLDDKVVKAFGGVSKNWLAELDAHDLPDFERRRSIVVSGRISAWEKHTETILKAGPPPPGWTIEFVGEVNANLALIIAKYRKKDPMFDSHYIFHGGISDKRAYFDIMMRTRALLLNSRLKEGFPNVFAEAHFCRLLIITSAIGAANDATANGKWGMVYRSDDVDSLRQALDCLPSRAAPVPIDASFERFRRQFIWEHSLDHPAIRRVFDNPA